MNLEFKTNDKYGELVFIDGKTRVETGLLNKKEMLAAAESLSYVVYELIEHANNCPEVLK